jgi:hypothetical protein
VVSSLISQECLKTPPIAVELAHTVVFDRPLVSRLVPVGKIPGGDCLEHSTDKWLDIRTLIERILPSILFEQNGELVRFAFQTPAVKYFTAPILTVFAKSDDSISCQSHYHTALCAHLGGAIEIIKGYRDAKPSGARVWEEGKAARECKSERDMRDRTIAQFAKILSHVLAKVCVSPYFQAPRIEGIHNHGQYSSWTDCTIRLAGRHGHDFDGLCSAKLGKRSCDDDPDQARDRHLSRERLF